MQNITAARLLPGFLGPAAGEWCAPLSFVQVFSLVSWLRFFVAGLRFTLLELGRAEVRKFRLWALLPIVNAGDSVKTSQHANMTGEVMSVRGCAGGMQRRQEAEGRCKPFPFFKRSDAVDLLTGALIQRRSEGLIFPVMLMAMNRFGLRWVDSAPTRV